MFEMLLKWFVLDSLSHSFFICFFIYILTFMIANLFLKKDFVDKDCIVMKLKL